MIGSARQRVGFKRHLRAEVKALDSAFLFSERGVIAIRGAEIAAIAPLLDGTRDFAGLVQARPVGMGAGRVAAVLAELADADLVAIREPAAESEPDDRALAFWDQCGVAWPPVKPATVQVIALDTEREPVENALRDAGLTVTDSEHDAALSVVLCNDYLDPRLAEIDRGQRARCRPWLLCKPTGAQIWVGPVLLPGESACWHCLAHRLGGHRHAEACAQASLGHSGPAQFPLAAVPPLTAAGAHMVALEATKWLAGYRYAGQRGVWVLDSFDFSTSRHELRRRPQCPACGDPTLVATAAAQPVVLRSAPKTSRLGGGHRTSTPEEVLDRYAHLISPITGVVKEVRRAPSSPAFTNAFRSGPNVLRSRTGLAALRAGLRSENGGKGVTAIEARVGALCEAIERHSGCYTGEELRISDSLRSIGSDALHPNDCMLFDARQFRTRLEWNGRHAAFQHVCESFDEHAVRDWTPLWSLTNDTQRLLPTAMLYYGAPGAIDIRADSNGAAAGSSVEDAILQGLLEVIERDAVALWWYNRTPVPGVDVAAFGDRWVADIREQYARLHRELWVLDITADLGVPVFAAVSRCVTSGAERIIFGFGAHLDPAVALRRAVTELNQMLPSVLADQSWPDDPDAARWLRTASVAGQPYVRPRADVPPTGPADIVDPRRADIRDDVTALVDLLRHNDMETLVLDQTRPDIDLPVVRVVVPGLRPFWARFAPGRLFDVPVRLGRLAEPTRYDDLNPIPMFL
jgi:bacteriocin biosynthesis cyclodehydratase domain-containing protein